MNIFNHPNPNPWTSLPFRINGPEVAWRFTNAQSGLSQCVKNQKLVQNVQSNMVDFVNVRFIIWKVWDVQPFLTHAVLKTRKHRAWRFASAAFCCHSCKRDDKLHQHHQHHHQQQNTHQLIITSQSRTKKPPKKIQHKLQSFFWFYSPCHDDQGIPHESAMNQGQTSAVGDGAGWIFRSISSTKSQKRTMRCGITRPKNKWHLKP